MVLFTHSFTLFTLYLMHGERPIYLVVILSEERMDATPVKDSCDVLA